MLMLFQKSPCLWKTKRIPVYVSSYGVCQLPAGWCYSRQTHRHIALGLWTNTSRILSLFTPSALLHIHPLGSWDVHLNILAQPPPTFSTFYRTISSTLCTYQTKVQPDGQSRATERQTSWSLAYSYGLKYRPVTLSNRLRAEWGGGPVHMPAMWQSIKAWVIASCDMRVLPAGTRQDCILKSSLERSNRGINTIAATSGGRRTSGFAELLLTDKDCAKSRLAVSVG